MTNNKDKNGLTGFAERFARDAHSLDGYRQVTGTELREHMQEVFGVVTATEAHRLAAAWRVVRALAAAQGHVDAGTPLRSVPEGAWNKHTAAYTQGQPTSAPPWVQEVVRAQVPLLPHALLNDGDADGLERYWEAVSLIGGRLGLRDTREGRLGLGSLLDMLLDDSEGTWPEAWQLIALEDAIVQQTFETATSSPDVGSIACERRAWNFLLHDLGLSRPEVESMLALARNRAIEAMPRGQEELRALQFHALSDGAKRAAQQHDLRAEVAFRRLLAQVTGVTRTEPENALQEFVHAVKRVVAAERAELPEGRTRALPAPKAAPEGESIPCADPGDPEAEALADFDRENQVGRPPQGP
jgi:uncharacterized protein YjiS (DUF1127 family)